MGVIGKERLELGHRIGVCLEVFRKRVVVEVGKVVVVGIALVVIGS